MDNERLYDEIDDEFIICDECSTVFPKTIRVPSDDNRCMETKTSYHILVEDECVTLWGGEGRIIRCTPASHSVRILCPECMKRYYEDNEPRWEFSCE